MFSETLKVKLGMMEARFVCFEFEFNGSGNLQNTYK